MNHSQLELKEIFKCTAPKQTFQEVILKYKKKNTTWNYFFVTQICAKKKIPKRENEITFEALVFYRCEITFCEPDYILMCVFAMIPP